MIETWLRFKMNVYFSSTQMDDEVACKFNLRG